jgi:hypothetical protein
MGIHALVRRAALWLAAAKECSSTDSDPLVTIAIARLALIGASGDKRGVAHRRQAGRRRRAGL